MNLRKKLVSAAVGSALALAASAAIAAPTFTINPLALGNTTPALVGLGEAPFVADFIGGVSSELARFPTASTTTGAGYLLFTSFNLNSNPVSPLTTSLNLDYKLYATFQLAGTLASGPGGQPPGPNSSYTLTQADFQVYADTDTDTTFTPASGVGAGSEAVVTQNTPDILLAVGSLIEGTAGINALGGAFVNVIDTFTVCTGPGTGSLGGIIVPVPGCTSGVGSSFFQAPVPFYNLVFGEFNNTTQGLDPTTGGDLAINSATGGVDFNRAAVPEPSSLALLGIAFAGLGFASRRKNKTQA